jgi:hypothetical protein
MSMSEATNSQTKLRRSYQTSSFSSNIPPATSTRRLLSFLIKSLVFVIFMVASKLVFKYSFACAESASQRVYFLSGITVPKLLLRMTAAKDLISNGASGSKITAVR